MINQTVKTIVAVIILLTKGGQLVFAGKNVN